MTRIGDAQLWQDFFAKVERLAEAAKEDPTQAREVRATIRGRGRGPFHSGEAFRGQRWQVAKDLVLDVAEAYSGLRDHILDDDTEVLEDAVGLAESALDDLDWWVSWTRARPRRRVPA